MITPCTSSARTPTPSLLRRLANFQMLPAKWAEEKGKEYLATNANGTGPYRLKEWKRGVHVILEAKEDYWKGAPAIKTIVFRPIKEIATQISELMTGGIDIVRDIPPDQIPLIENSRNRQNLEGSHPPGDLPCDSTPTAGPANPRCKT